MKLSEISKDIFIICIALFWLTCSSTSPPPYSLVSAQNVGNSFITLEVGMDVCQNPSYIFMDDAGTMYVLCNNGIVRKSGGVVSVIHNATSSCEQGAITKHPVTGMVYASCEGEGIFQIDGETITTIVNHTLCATALSFAQGTIAQNFLIARCYDVYHYNAGGLMRVNLTNFHVDVLLNWSDCIGSASGIAYYSENGHDYVVAACQYPPLVRFNLSDRSSTAIEGPDDCNGASSIARDSDTGILWVSCLSTGGVAQVNGTNMTTVLAMKDCLSPTQLRYDARTNVKYVTCSGSGTIAITNDNRVSLVVKESQCFFPFATVGVDGAILVACQSTGVIRVPSITVSLAVSDSSCSSATSVAVNEATGAIITSCANTGIIVTQNNVDTVLAGEADCKDLVFSGLILRGGYLFAQCLSNKSLVIFEMSTSRVQHVSIVQVCGDQMDSYDPDPSTNTIYFACNPAGMRAFNMTSGVSRPLLPYASYGKCSNFVKDRVTNSLYIAFLSNGLVRLDLASNNASTVMNSTLCPNVYNVIVGNDGIVYADCFVASTGRRFIFVINGTSSSSSNSITTLPVDPQCQMYANALSFNSATKTLFVTCSPEAGIYAVNVTSNVWTLVIPIEQCPLISYFPVQDSTTLSVYVACGSMEVQVSSRDFQCQQGSMWSSGRCVACSPQTHRPYDNLLPFGACVPCDAGYVAPAVGSSTCTPCEAGTYDSKSTCFLCPSGKYQPSNASTSCIDCPTGRYSLYPGSTSCAQCNPGFYANINGTVSCSPCTSGSASNITGLDRPCDGCLPGTYQPAIAQTTCFTCPAHSYAEQANSTSCTRCADRVNDARTSCTFVLCDPNTQFNDITGQCDVCPISEYSSRGGLCSTCNVQTYTPAAGSGCAPGEGIDGLLCSGGIAQVLPGYWAYISSAPEATWHPLDGNITSQSYQLYRTAPCPFCLGAVLQVIPTQSSSNGSSSFVNGSSSPSSDSSIIQYCVYPRLNSVNNTLCARCEEDYLAWGSSCVTCNQANASLIFAYLLLSLALVLFLFYSSTNPSSAGSLSILLFFIQTAALEMGSIAEFLDWIQVVVNLDPKSAGSCLAPWTAYQQTLLALLVPIILIGELMIVAIIHYLLYKFVFGDFGGDSSNHNSSPNMDVSISNSVAQQMNFSDRVCHFFLVRLRRFSLDDYYVGVLSILLFCYTQVATASVRYLHCVDVDEERLNFTAPTIDCKSNEYKQYLVPVILAITVYIIGLPLVAGTKLWRNRQSLYSAVQSAKPPPPHQADLSGQASFLHHWSPFYRMYHPRAFYWQCGILLRRAAFAVTAVLLIQQNSYRFMVFAFLHFGSLLLHLYVRPYEAENLNRMETVSYVLLVSISLLLTGVLPPYHLGIQILLFAMVVPPALWMVSDVIMQRVQSWRKGRIEKKNKQMNEDEANSAPPVGSNGLPATTAATGSIESPSLPSRRDIELSSVSTHMDTVEQNHHHEMNESILPAIALNDSERQSWGSWDH